MRAARSQSSTRVRRINSVSVTHGIAYAESSQPHTCAFSILVNKDDAARRESALDEDVSSARAPHPARVTASALRAAISFLHRRGLSCAILRS